MPDLERLTDRLAEHLAPTPEARARAQGFTAGKTAARSQIAKLALALALLWVAGGALLLQGGP